LTALVSLLSLTTHTTGYRSSKALGLLDSREEEEDEAAIDEELSRLLSPESSIEEHTFDSIMDSDTRDFD
jgi:hypothetical protein